jgi:(2R)-3-sulfolactate dehydrogenase (NADP+)
VTRRFTLEAATVLAARAVCAAGASEEAARSLARATVSANAHGKGSSGFSHLMDYLAALRAGRIAGDAEPVVSSPAPAAIHCDARGGIAQVGFDRAFDSLRERAKTFGIALFAQNGSYTTGELGYYPRRLAEAGLVAFAATSGPALMTVAGATRRGAAAPDRPGVQRDRLCPAPTLCGTGRAAARGLGGRRQWRADHRS